MKDLVLEVVKAFPVWPEGATHIVTTCPAWDGRSELQDTFEPSYDGRDKNGSNFLFGREAWQIACTREQHIRKRVELFENYRPSMGSVMLPNVTLEDLNYIAEIENKNNALDDATDTDVGEWGGEGLPPVGTKCKIMCDYILCGVTPFKLVKGDTVVVRAIVNLGFGDVALISDEKVSGSGTIIFSQLLPLKTEAEKERERLFKKVLDAINPDGMTYYDVDTVGDFISDLIDKGLIK